MRNGTFLGPFALGDTLVSGLLVTNGDDEPADPSGNLPNYRIYGDGALIANGTGSLSKMDTFTVTAATNASPIAITTSAAHGLETGNHVVIASVGGNTAANGTFTITKTGSTSFTLDGSSGSGAYTSGGTGHVAGLYKISHALSSGDGYEAGKVYNLLVTYDISGALSDMHTFQVC